MTVYQIYGLNIASDFPIEAEIATVGSPDIAIRKSHFPLPEMKSGEMGLLYHVSPDTIYLQWDRIGSFRIHSGREITVMPNPNGDEKIFQRQLTGAILAMALFQRRRFIIHASAVAVGGAAVVFSGESGFGKSTIASSLHARGCQLLADDIVTIQVGEKAHQVYPGIQEFKLWPDSVRILGEDETNLRRFNPQLEKRLRPVAEGLQKQSVPLGLIYMLDFDEAAAVERIEPAQGAIELVRNTYGVTLLHEIRTSDFFHQIVRIAQSVPIIRLKRERSLDRFDRFLAMVERDIAERLGASSSS